MNKPANDVFDNLDCLKINNLVASPKVAAKSFDQKEKKKILGEFLKGPIPLPWLTAAAQLSGKAPVAVGLAIWFEAGRRKSNEVKLTSAILQRFAIKRKSKYSALKSLEDAGLIRVRREPRKNPMVTILEVFSPPKVE